MRRTPPQLPCPPARWPVFSHRLDALLALPDATARAAALAALPADEADLAPALAAVLAATPLTERDDFLAAGPQLPASPAGDPGEGPSGLQPGQRIGPYALMRELGRGGMGVVWLAERADGAFQRTVALKLPHRHLLENLNAAAVRERFARERDILAGLAHPHIAAFFDAGVTPDGQPWLALEAVPGEPLTDWCRARALPLAQRLALFDQVLAAVDHAHARFVAHRDIKPANVLVTPAGEVKLLDFGIARLLHADDPAAADSTALTREGSVLATPRYAAPEQLTGGPVTAATDVHALGLMLFELLTDAPAFDGTLATRPADREPPLPSRRAATPALRRALAGDLDAITVRALQPRPADRYASVAALADDLRRQREHRPIRARRITAWAQAWRYVQRHRLPVALASALGLALIAGSAGVAWQAHEARAQARRAEAVKDFLLGVFSAADPRLPGGKPDGATTAKTLLDRSAARIDERFATDPELRSELLRTAADIYRELGEDAAYADLLARHVALVRERHGPLHDDVLAAGIDRAAQAYKRGDQAACRRLLAELDGPIRQAGRDHSALRAHWWMNQGICQRNQPDQAAQRLVALRRAEALFAELERGQRGHVTVWSEIATEHNSAMRLPEALAANQRAIELAERLPGRNEAELQTLYANRGTQLQQAGQLAESALALGRAADIAERTSGADFATAWLPRARHARTLHLAGDRAAALPLFEALMRRLPPPEAALPDASMARELYGERLNAEGRPALALPLLQAAEAGFRRKASFEFDLRRCRRNLGDALAQLGRLDQAREVLALAKADFEAHDQPHTQPSSAMQERWARLLLETGDLDGAQQHYQRLIDVAANKHWAHVTLAHAGLARVALARGDAAAALRHSADALAGWQGLSGFRDVRMQQHLWRVRAAALLADGQAAEGRALREQALAAARRTDAPDSRTLTQPDYLGL